MGETLRRIKHLAATRVTEMLWEREANRKRSWPPLPPRDVIDGLLDPTDVEDLVLLYLQTDGWLLLPSSRMHDTPVYDGGRLSGG